MQNFVDYLIIHMFILERGNDPQECSSQIYEFKCKYNIYFCIDYQIYDHNIQ